MKGIILFFVAALIMASRPPSLTAVEAGDTEVRPAAVAGMFYPGDGAVLRASVQSYLEKAKGGNVSGKIRALIAPHAGYIYSGIVAAAGYRQIDPGINKVILLGPSHRIPLGNPSIPPFRFYETPLGKIPLAPVAELLRGLPEIASVRQAHAHEHAIEVQLPFLQVALHDFEILPILIHRSDPQRLAAILESLVDDRTMVVASSDLSHYYSYDTAVSLDKQCADAVVSGNLRKTARCEACGKEAILTLLHLAQKKGWQGKLVDYKNSGDTSGDRNRVVGYATIAFVDGKKEVTKMAQHLSDGRKKELLRFARSVIETRLDSNTTVQRPSPSSCPDFVEERGCFVTLHKNGRLRGCIGSIRPVSDLLSCVEENAQNAAFRDPRFPGLEKDELAEVDLEISILTVPKTIRFKDGEDLKRQLKPSVHGVILTSGSRRSTFLPQVWHQLPDKEKFLEHLCIKGGMPPDAWRDPRTTVEIYEAEVFGEKNLP